MHTQLDLVREAKHLQGNLFTVHVCAGHLIKKLPLILKPDNFTTIQQWSLHDFNVMKKNAV